MGKSGLHGVINVSHDFQSLPWVPWDAAPSEEETEETQADFQMVERPSEPTSGWAERFGYKATGSGVWEGGLHC